MTTGEEQGASTTTGASPWKSFLTGLGSAFGYNYGTPGDQKESGFENDDHTGLMNANAGMQAAIAGGIPSVRVSDKKRKGIKKPGIDEKKYKQQLADEAAKKKSVQAAETKASTIVPKNWISYPSYGGNIKIG
jgi:hypothetical protein